MNLSFVFRVILSLLAVGTFGCTENKSPDNGQQIERTGDPQGNEENNDEVEKTKIETTETLYFRSGDTQGMVPLVALKVTDKDDEIVGLILYDIKSYRVFADTYCNDESDKKTLNFGEGDSMTNSLFVDLLTIVHHIYSANTGVCEWQAESLRNEKDYLSIHIFDPKKEKSLQAYEMLPISEKQFIDEFRKLILDKVTYTERLFDEEACMELFGLKCSHMM